MRTQYTIEIVLQWIAVYEMSDQLVTFVLVGRNHHLKGITKLPSEGNADEQYKLIYICVFVYMNK